MVTDNRVGVVINLNFSLVDGNFICVAKDGSNFFQRQESGVRESEQHDKPTGEGEQDKENIEFPSRSSS